MAKFVIECPACDNYIQASTGLFARRNVKCSCGNLVNIQANRMTSRVCAHCGNTVVFDAKRGDKAKCPVCKNLINTVEEQSRTDQFTCAQCGITLRADKNAATYTCPVCDCVNDVQERMAKDRISRQGVASLIKYEGDNETLIWKHPIEDFNTGSQVIVHESQVAVFFRDGQALDMLGAGRHTLETQSVPILEKVYKLPTDSTKTFHAEVYYINLTTQMGIKWGTDSRVRVKDPVNGFYVNIGAGGNFNLRVTDPRRLLQKVVGTTGGLKQQDILAGVSGGYFRPMIMTNVKTFLAQTIRNENINILDIDAELMRLSEGLKILLNQQLQDYGLSMPEFYVTRIVTPDESEDPNFARLQQQFADEVLNVRDEEIQTRTAEARRDRMRVEAQTEAEMKIIGAQGDAEAYKIQQAAEADAIRMRAQAEAEEMRMKGYTYQQETARKVSLEAMQNGLGGLGGSTGGLGDIAGLGISLGAMGGVIGMTREAMSGLTAESTALGNAARDNVSDTWTCSCGCTGITSKFCPDCGTPKPVPKVPGSWNCTCGCSGITSKFCPDCGTPKPAEPDTWTCSCGCSGITSKFCPDCGSSRPAAEPATWTCRCGCTGITSKFCPECGSKKGE